MGMEQSTGTASVSHNGLLLWWNLSLDAAHRIPGLGRSPEASGQCSTAVMASRFLVRFFSTWPIWMLLHQRGFVLIK